MTDRLGALLAGARDLALPPRCPGCGEIVTAADRFCAACWSGLTFLGPPWCAGCNVPFDHDLEGLCDDCTARRPDHGGVRAAVAYGETARTLALRLKYGGRTAHAVTAARLMRRHLPEDATLLVPVPLHRWRLWKRGYNQAALIADALTKLSGINGEAGLLRRTRATPPLRGMNPAQRRAAVEGVFALDPAIAHKLEGQHVVLVDDVYTSGATTDGCVSALRAGGARAVTILAWARVLDAHQAD